MASCSLSSYYALPQLKDMGGCYGHAASLVWMQQSLSVTQASGRNKPDCVTDVIQ